MDIRKLAPWNWFKEEEHAEARNLPVSGEFGRGYPSLMEFHNELDRLFERAWRNFSDPLGAASTGLMGQTFDQGFLKPKVDISATDDEYAITVEVPGVEEDDIKLELVDNTLTIRGTKRHESSKKEKDLVSVERAYGTFQRVLSLPDDADHGQIEASFHNGVLDIVMPRKAKAERRGKTIEIRPAA